MIAPVILIARYYMANLKLMFCWQEQPLVLPPAGQDGGAEGHPRACRTLVVFIPSWLLLWF